MQSERARKALEVVEYERVIQLLRGLLQARRRNAVPRQEHEGNPSARAQRVRVHPQAAEVAYDEAAHALRRARYAHKRVLRVRLEGDSVVQQGRDERGDEQPSVPVAASDADCTATAHSVLVEERRAFVVRV